MEGYGWEELVRAGATVGYAPGGGSPAVEVDRLADEGDGTQAGGPALEGVDMAWEGEQGAARGGPAHAGGSQG